MKLGQTSVVHLLSRIAFTVVGFLTTVYLARELGAETVGTYYLTISLLYWFIVAGNFGLSGSLRKRLSESNARPGILAAGIVAQFGLVGVTIGLVLLFGTDINEYVGASIARWLVVLLVTKLAYDFVTVVLDGQHKVHVSSLLSPLNKTVQSAVQVGLTAAGVGLVGLFVGYASGGIVAVLAGVWFVRADLKLPTYRDFRSLYDFTRYSWLGNLKGRAFLSMDTILLGYYLASNELVGVYEIAWNVSALFAIFSASLNRSSFPEISSIPNERTDRLRDLVSATVAYAGLFLIPGLVGSALVGDVVLGIYGDAFVQGRTVLVVLVLSQLVYAYEGKFLTALSGMDYPGEVFRVNAGFLVVNLILNIVLIPRVGWIGAAIATTASATVGLMLGYQKLRNRLRFRIPWDELLRQAIASMVMGVVVYSGRVLIGDSLPVAVGLIVFGAAVYFLSLAAISKQFRTVVSENLPIDVQTLR